MLEERNVTRAASRVGLSQPGLSNALGRLRELLGDPLFVRTGRGMAPTSRALEMAGPVRSALAQLRTTLSGARGFAPSTSSRIIRLATIDYAEMLLLGGVLLRFEREAPRMQLLVRRLPRLFQAPEAELRSGEVDAALGFFPDSSAVEPGTHVLNLLTEENVCIARRGHPILKGRLTAARFASAPQIGIFYRFESRGLIDNVLAESGLSRKLQATAPHFLTVPHIVARSDLIACVPAGLARRSRKELRLEIRKLPIALPPLHLRLAWHERTNRDPALEWFRSLVVQAAAPIP
jgi:DNA-binding transcriptional LysR family regulator